MGLEIRRTNITAHGTQDTNPGLNLLVVCDTSMTKTLPGNSKIYFVKSCHRI